MMSKDPQVDKPEASARDRILNAAVDVVAEHGYSAAGVQEIVELSGTSKGSFYFHFHSKEDMVMALVERMSDKLVSKIQESIKHQPTPLHRVAASIDALLATFFRQRKVAHVLLLNIVGQGKATDKKFLPIRERFSNLVQRELDAAVQSGQIKPLDTTLVSQMWVGAIHEVILRWLLTSRPSPLDGAALALRETLLRSIGADPVIVRPRTRLRTDVED